MRTLIPTGIALALFAGHATAGTFIDVGVPGGQLTGLSHNGRIASGVVGGGSWRWAKDRGAIPLDGFGDANGMSAWGQPVAGSTTDGEGNKIAAIAYSNFAAIGGPTLVGGWPGAIPQDDFLSSAYDASDTGVVVGLAIDASGIYFAFRWTAMEGMSRLQVNHPENASRANAISADGTTIVGWNDADNGGRNGVIWQDGIPLELVDGSGGPVGEALAVSSDGSVVVGSGYFNASTGESEAWRWTAATGVQSIGCLSDGFSCGPASAFAVSDDGNVVLGDSGFGFSREATIWTSEGGIERISDYATAHGVTVPALWELKSGGGVSADGKTLAGWGLSPGGLDSWIIDLHEDLVTEARVQAHGTVNWNDLSSGPFAGIALGTPVEMHFRITAVDSTEFDPGRATYYLIVPGSLTISAGAGSETLGNTAKAPGLLIGNDYPLSDGIHLFRTPTSTANQGLEFELFNPGGNLFDSDDLDRINRTIGPEFFEKASWSIEGNGGSEGMYMDLLSVRIEDVVAESDTIFADGFDVATP